LNKHRQIFEFALGLVILTLLILIGRLEIRLLELSKDLSVSREFLSSVIYFGFINLNVVFILILSFLIFRNVVKLLLDKRRNVFGSSLRIKLVTTLAVFAGAPTLLMFYISYWFITESFDNWFSARVKTTMHQTREVSAALYEQDQVRIESLARIALQRLQIQDSEHVDTRKLRGFAKEYKIDEVKVFDADLRLVFPESNLPLAEAELEFLQSALNTFRLDANTISKVSVEVVDDKDVVKGISPILGTEKNIIGLIVTEQRFNSQILKTIESILNEFAKLRPGAQIHRIGYLGLLIVTVLVIIFATMWLGFYVARAISDPLIKLSEASRRIAKGEYDIDLEIDAHDETGELVGSFKSMAEDLKKHEIENLEVLDKLRTSNENLIQQSQYIEAVLRHVTAGVISVDNKGHITSFNDAAERLLGFRAEVGIAVIQAFSGSLYEKFWRLIEDGLRQNRSFSGDIPFDQDMFMVAGVKIYDESGADLGSVVVFDDATEQVKVQRVAAWREVARRIAHEIKNPITPIKLSAQRLLRRYEDRFEGDDHEVFVGCIETILAEVDSLKDLVNEFSKFTRLPSIKLKPEPLNELVRESLRMFRVSYPEIDFKCVNLDASIDLVMLDREQFHRVLFNLVQNAVAALTEARVKRKVIELLTELDTKARVVRVVVIDTGKGIPPEVRARVFEPYFSTKKEGTGLGLAIVNQIVADHGGYIRIIDHRPQGTRIIIELPLAEKVS
jgi:two-component system, NtrC family, nitrogen regulation sensor histidine kinase NtrY